MNKKLIKSVGIAFSLLLVSQLSNAQSDKESIKRGKTVYLNECISCHQEDGEGIMGAFPPLVNSDYFKDDLSKAVNAIINGVSGELEVNGTTYYGEMPPVSLTDQQVTDVLNYIQVTLNNKTSTVSVEDIVKMKD